MLVSILASGSEGNSTYVETKDTKLLIDAGMNTKYLKESLNKLGTDLEEIEYIFMTHAHKDHTGSLKVLLKNYNPMIVVSRGIFEELEEIHEYRNTIITDDIIEKGSTVVDNFKTSHDAKGSRGYLINDGETSLVYMTDTGYLNQKYFKKLFNKTIYIMEANHDVEMLMNGPYPAWLKTRILSDKGHLSNNASGFYLSKLIGPETKKIILAHLSHENNTPELALKTVKKTLREYEIEFENIDIAKQKEIVEVNYD